MSAYKSEHCLEMLDNTCTVSERALVHSSKGQFTKPTRKKDRPRLKSGGHGQEGLLLLEKYEIEYNIVKTYPNGVRVGNIPDHKDKRKTTGTNQTWFPPSWSLRKIQRAGEYVAGLKRNLNSPDGKAVFGTYYGVRVGIIRTNGKIATVFPDQNQEPALKRKKMVANKVDGTLSRRLKVNIKDHFDTRKSLDVDKQDQRRVEVDVNFAENKLLDKQ